MLVFTLGLAAFSIRMANIPSQMKAVVLLGTGKKLVECIILNLPRWI